MAAAKPGGNDLTCDRAISSGNNASHKNGQQCGCPICEVHPKPQLGAEVELLAKINEAVAAANEAETGVTTAQAELVSRSKAVGLLLLEAKKLHPAVADFETFLKQVHGLKLSRAYDLLRLAGGRTTDEEIRKATRDRVKKHRASKKLPRPVPAPKKPEPPKLSVTSPDVTETAEASAERRKAENATTAEEKAVKVSTHNLAEFVHACHTYLPKLNEADLERACHLVNGWRRSKAEAA
jgi:hypothetical protein